MGERLPDYSHRFSVRFAPSAWKAERLWASICRTVRTGLTVASLPRLGKPSDYGRLA